MSHHWILIVGLFAMALNAMACAAEMPEGRTLDLNTEIARFFLFHPDDLQHRKTSPSLWTLYEFAVAPEFAAGNLVAFSTGADGGYRIRLTQGELTAREKSYESCAWDFRYKVRHGRVLIDGGDFVPSDPSRDFDVFLPPDALDSPPDPIPDEQWFAVPNGDYKVTVSAIDWTNEPGAVDRDGNARKKALPGYVIQFKKADRLDAVKSATYSPDLEPGPQSEPTFRPVSVDDLHEGDMTRPVPETVPVVVAPDLALVPGFPTSPLVIPAKHPAYPELSEEGSFPTFSDVLLVNSEKRPGIGVLASVSGASGERGGAWKVAFQPERIVKVLKLEAVEHGFKATIAGIERPAGTVSAADLTALKSAFATYAKTNETYRHTVKFPDFEAERVQAMTSPSSISSTLLHHVAMPAKTRTRLLPQSDADRVKELFSILTSRRGDADSQPRNHD